MSAAGETPYVALVRGCFAALRQGDYATLERVLAEKARWEPAIEGVGGCEGRHAILAVMKRNVGGRLRGRIEEATQHGPRVLVGFRPEQPPRDTDERPLDRGIAYVVVTVADGEITELKGYATRDDALRYAQAGESL
jgi:ketosteroid isomerase-like protein